MIYNNYIHVYIHTLHCILQPSSTHTGLPAVMAVSRHEDVDIAACGKGGVLAHKALQSTGHVRREHLVFRSLRAQLRIANHHHNVSAHCRAGQADWRCKSVLISIIMHAVLNMQFVHAYIFLLKIYYVQTAIME